MAYPAISISQDKLQPGRAQPARRLLLPGWRPIAWVVVLAFLSAAAMYPLAHNTYIELLGEMLFVGIVLLAGFTAAGSWNQHYVPRWAAQVIGVAVAAPLGPLVVQLLGARGDVSAFLASPGHVRGYVMVTLGGGLLGSLVALGALLRKREAEVAAQALQFRLERETLERQATDARLRLMTAQVQPHFLLNTLANVQELVETNSPRAVPVFRSLIGYLRAALPQIQQDNGTLADEDRLVRAYLELMHMRMPDRLSFSVEIDPQLLSMPFPALALLTLVENAIRHGIDPGLSGGRVEVGARRADAATVHLWVADTGVGISDSPGQGTGLANLQARIGAFFGEVARLELTEQAPHGVRADLWLPVAA